MAVFLYADHESAPDVQTRLAELAQQTESTRGLLTLLGDYWSAYYKDLGVLTQGISGAVTGVSREFDRAFETLLSGNISDIPVEQGRLFDLFVFNKADFQTVYDENGEVDSYFVSLADSDVTNINYLTVSLFESPVVLVKDTHYKIEPGVGIYFYVDIFSDPSITPYEYSAGEGASQSVLLWGSGVALSSRYVYQRYGRFLYRKATDSYQYKWFVASLMRFYTGAKTCDNIKNVLDILFGMPYARYDGEVIQSLTHVDDNLNDWPADTPTEEAPYVKIVTDKNTYYTYGMAEMKYGVGDSVPQYALFSEFCTVMDYVNTPRWWVSDGSGDGSSMGLPWSIIINGSEGLDAQGFYDLMDRVLKYNIVYTQVNTTFESYALYRAVVNDLYDIIKGGFPTYLYAFVEVLFRVRFVDVVDIVGNTEDWLDLHTHLTFSDVFCKFFKYDGTYLYDGSKLHFPWDCGGRMQDSADLVVDVKLVDLVRMPPILYDGRFIHNSDIPYHTPDVFAIDSMPPVEAHLAITDTVTSDEKLDIHAETAPFSDEFCVGFYYDGEYDHSCRKRYQGRGCDERLADAMEIYAVNADGTRVAI